MSAPPMTRRTRQAALMLMLSGAATSVFASAEVAPVYEGYDALWKTLPAPAFTLADERPLDAPQSFEGHGFRAWGPVPRDGERGRPGQHRIEVLGPDITIDHHAFPFARATVFPGEPPAEPGDDARLFVGPRDVCVQGTAPSASGTAQRHVHVAVVTDAFTKGAHRYDLPSLFGSCLAISRDGRGGLRFFAGSYHTAAGAQVSDGVDFEPWRLRGGRFMKTGGAPLRIRFPDPDDVYRFSIATP